MVGLPAVIAQIRKAAAELIALADMLQKLVPSDDPRRKDDLYRPR